MGEALQLSPRLAQQPRKRLSRCRLQRADLESAWRELSQTLGEFNVTSLRACSREGRHWSEDPEAVRAIAGTIDSIMDDTSEGPKDSPAP